MPRVTLGRPPNPGEGPAWAGIGVLRLKLCSHPGDNKGVARGARVLPPGGAR